MQGLPFAAAARWSKVKDRRWYEWEWTAIAATEPDVVREMTRCLRLIREGGWPT
jgi:hypothetical protein